MKNKTTPIIWLSALLSAILLSLPFLIPHCGWISLFALVPLLMSERMAAETGMKHFWAVHYMNFLVFNLLTTWWVCNATVGGGIFASVANAFQMWVVFGLFRISRKRFKGTIPYIFLMCTWIAWEHIYFNAQISWPWLVLGNSFARSIGWVQWYEYTGALGGSLWIWMCNLAVFAAVCSVREHIWERWNLKARLSAPVALLILFIAPPVCSLLLWKTAQEESGKSLDLMIAQPNIDPYHKFEFLSQTQQNEILASQIKEGLGARKDSSNPLLILAPETFTSDVSVAGGKILGSSTLERLGKETDSCRNTALLFGASCHEYIYSNNKPSQTARRYRDGLWIESHNSAILCQNGRIPQIYHKSKLVPAVEMTPYPAFFCKIDDMLGGVMGRCIGQERATALRMKSDCGDIAVAPVICYESIYGEYCTGYVRDGAQMIAIITNDAWWKDTAGYKQHLSYASLRAIETRRWIARCGNTGISAIIDSKGRILDKTSWWEKDLLEGNIKLCDRQTFFVRHGDMTGRACSFLCILLFGALVVRIVTDVKKPSKKQNTRK